MKTDGHGDIEYPAVGIIPGELIKAEDTEVHLQNRNQKAFCNISVNAGMNGEISVT